VVEPKLELAFEIERGSRGGAAVSGHTAQSVPLSQGPSLDEERKTFAPSEFFAF
jgi:hypothetical protein